jgi:hypothetical protein
MTDEYRWVLMTRQLNCRRMWKLKPAPHSFANLGMLAEGYTQNPGWHIYRFAYDPPIATLPRTIGRDEAMNAAKMILLTLKENT